MDDHTRMRLEQMSRKEWEARFTELRKKLELDAPVLLNGGGIPGENSLEEHEEYAFLKALLGQK